MEEKVPSSAVDDVDSKQSSWGPCDKLNNVSYRKRFLHSCWLALCSLTLGVVFGQQGPTFLDLQIITNTDVESASFFFTGASLGYMVGSFASGFVHGKVNNNILMCIVNTGAGLAAIATPYCSPYPLMIIIRFTTNMFCGGIDTLVGAEHMRLWGKDGRALLQMIHFTFALGGVLTPVFTEPFVAPKYMSNATAYVGLNASGVNLTLNSSLEHLGRPTSTNIHYAFLISGSIAIMIAVPFLFLFFSEKASTSQSDKYMQADVDRKLPGPVYVFMLVVLCFFYVVYCCLEDTFASFLMTFVVTEYESVSKSDGAYITMYYWIAFASGRFGSIFVSRLMTARNLILLYSSFMIVSFAGFSVSAAYAHIGFLITFACMAGVSMSAVFPAGYSWTEAELFRVTGWVSSFILIGGSLGMMINPMIVGYLMKHESNMWFCYILLAESILMFAVFSFLLVFNKCYVDKKYGLVATSKNLEIHVESSNKDANLKLMSEAKEGEHPTS